ncbi:hypothetical protein BOTNAR_0315g00110 [Botryotinia narcissicola]|uniref:Uncharacterized protein n=1 Tax=Botryotinia narcissicola TaxID=278944 RepID=A0A4Z1HUW1_9HELO|nr:hypothetical protein BOTNAR_0315g00110 [Botryotinia narcissicola]
MGTGQRESRRTAPSIKRRLVDGAASGLLQKTARNQKEKRREGSPQMGRSETKTRDWEVDDGHVMAIKNVLIEATVLPYATRKIRSNNYIQCS